MHEHIFHSCLNKCCDKFLHIFIALLSSQVLPRPFVHMPPFPLHHYSPKQTILFDDICAPLTIFLLQPNHTPFSLLSSISFYDIRVG
jgi:hypothetical protein